MKTSDRVEILGWVVLIIFIILIILVSPIISIWSLNTLFKTDIPTNLWTYLATLWLTGLIAGGGVNKKK